MVARLNRVGRDIEHIADVIKLNAEIIVSDNQHANGLTIHLLAAVTEEQRQRTHEITKAAIVAENLPQITS